MSVYYYHLSYNEVKDEFFSYVDDGTNVGLPLFQIDDTDEMRYYIRTDEMKHIDDISGLEKIMKKLKLIDDKDIILICEEIVV